MTERRMSGWPWRKKSSAASQDSAAQEAAILAEALAQRRRADEAAAALKEELGDALAALAAKEAMVKQHEKVAEDAVSGWEKAEADASLLKQELQAASQQNSALADRGSQLDAALKECTRQLRLVKEEEAAKLAAAMAAHSAELEAERAAAEARQASQDRRIAECEARASAMAKTLQERARKIVEANEAIAKAEAEAAMLQMKLAAAEKEIGSLRYELQVASKEVEIRSEEVEFVKKAAEAAHRQHLDNVKKMAGLEADVGRLRSLLKKKLPGPAALAQMRKEVEVGVLPTSPPPPPYASVTPHRMTRRGSRSPSHSSSSPAASYNIYAPAATSPNGGVLNREMELLRDRMLSVEEENNLLKEALSRRQGELQASRLLCARTATRLSIAEEELESALLNGGAAASSAAISNGNSNGHGYGNGNAVGSRKDAISDPHDDEAATEQDVNCAESWASALISELAHFKKDSPLLSSAAASHSRTRSDSLLTGDEDHLPPYPADHPSSTEKLPTDADTCTSEAQLSIPAGATTSSAGVPDDSSDVKRLCGALHGKLDAIAALLRRQAAQELPDWSGEEAADDVTVATAAVVAEARKELRELEKAITATDEVDSSRLLIMTDGGDGQDAEEAGAIGDGGRSVEEDNDHGLALKYMCSASVSCLSTSLSELMAAVEEAFGLAARGEDDNAKSGGVEEVRRQKMAELRQCKEGLLQGKSSLLEMLLRLGLLLCHASGREAVALQDTLRRELGGGGGAPGGNEVAEAAELSQRVQAAEEKAAEAERRREEGEAELATWKSSVESLRVQLAEQKRLSQELEQKRLGSVEEEGGGEEEEDPASRKERELTAAKEKLVECQRTIMVLGKQLTALSSTSPRGGHSPAASFDTTASSMESGLIYGPNGSLYNNNYYNNHQLQHHHHHHQQQYIVPLRESFDDGSIPHSARYQHRAPLTPPPRMWSRQMDDSTPTRPYNHNNNNNNSSVMDHQQYGFEHARLSGPIPGYHQYGGGNNAPYHHHHSGSGGGEQEDFANPSLALTVYRPPPPPSNGSAAAAAPVSPVKDSSSALSRLFKSKKRR